MITSSFFGTSSNTGIIWYTPTDLGEITSDDIIISLSTNLPCTYDLVIFGSVNEVAPFIIDDSVVMSNPKDNKEYKYSIVAKYGLLSSVRTFKFTAKRSRPVFITDSLIRLPSKEDVDYQLLIKEPRYSDSFAIINGWLHPNLSLTEDGRIVGTNPFDNTVASVTVQIDDGYYQETKQFTVCAPPNALEYELPTENTVDAYGINKGSFTIDDAWLHSVGWDGVYSNITVNVSSRYYPKDGNVFEGGGYNDRPTLTIDVKKKCELTVIVSGSIRGSWGHKGENYSDDSLFQYHQTPSLNGINGGIAVQIRTPCTLINNGEILGGAGGGGAGGCGVMYLGRTDPGVGGNGGAAIDIRSSNVVIHNQGKISGGGGGGAGGWGSELDGDEPGQPGTDGQLSGHGGHGGSGTGTNGSVGGIGGEVSMHGTNGTSVHHVPATGGAPGYAIQTEFTYSLLNEGTILGKIENF